MERETIKQLFGKNFIGKEELPILIHALGLGNIDICEKPVYYSDEVLLKAAEDDYILIWGLNNINGQPMTIRFFREKMGVNPDVFEPCLYNQDWYLNEAFIDYTIDFQWYLINKEVFANSRAVVPSNLLSQGITFPSAVLCCYTFFAYYFARKEILWPYDFIWCSDHDHNGDRIYVGRYFDIDGVNKNGFNIHRHLALRECYGAVNLIL